MRERIEGVKLWEQWCGLSDVSEPKGSSVHVVGGSAHGTAKGERLLSLKPHLDC